MFAGNSIRNLVVGLFPLLMIYWLQDSDIRKHSVQKKFKSNLLRTLSALLRTLSALLPPSSTKDMNYFCLCKQKECLQSLRNKTKHMYIERLLCMGHQHTRDAYAIKGHLERNLNMGCYQNYKQYLAEALKSLLSLRKLFVIY